jgi:hypothetical protein
MHAVAGRPTVTPLLGQQGIFVSAGVSDGMRAREAIDREAFQLTLPMFTETRHAEGTAIYFRDFLPSERLGALSESDAQDLL